MGESNAITYPPTHVGWGSAPSTPFSYQTQGDLSLTSPPKTPVDPVLTRSDEEEVGLDGGCPTLG